MRSGIFTQGTRTTRGAAAAAGMAMAGLLAGRQRSDSGTITAYVYGDDAVKVQQAAVDSFNKTSEVEVKLVAVPGSDYVNKLRSAMGSPSAPDVFHDWGAGSSKPYVDSEDPDGPPHA